MTAWLKLNLLCHAGATEIGAFAITREDHPLVVEEILAIRQTCTCASVEFDDEAVAAFFDEQVDQGRKPENFFRIWIHTHPGDSAQPSSTDEETFARVFGSCDWAVMFILARGGAMYCRLRVNGSPASMKGLLLERQIPVCIDYGRLLEGDLHLPTEQWLLEHKANVQSAPEWGRWWEQGIDDGFGCLDDLASMLDAEDVEVLEEQLKEVLDEAR